MNRICIKDSLEIPNINSVDRLSVTILATWIKPKEATAYPADVLIRIDPIF